MNQLARSNSAYLQQHAHNPVNWWPWGAEALESAASQGQWLLVSIGYSTCHWCHVMEREIFEDADCASFMNAHFKNIKVDREERPDLDHAYMQAALALNGQGGWPLNVICLPDGRPVWASTYLPKERWLGALQRLVEVQQNQGEVAGPYAQRLTEALEAAGHISTPSSLEIPPLEDSLMASESSKWDLDHGGFRGAPKFPLPSHWVYLLEVSTFRGTWPKAYSQAKKTLEAIFYSGSYDSVRGGLFRYSTDGVWKVPHFEKMAYDNGLWLRLCAQLYAHDPKSIYATAFERTAEWLLREMRLDDGLFAAAMDADTDGIEGGSFTWTSSDLEAALGQTEATSFLKLLETQGASWDHRWIIHWHPSQGLPTKNWLQHVAALRPAAMARSLPYRDPKCIQAWNAWLVSGLAEGALNFPPFRAIAREAAEAHWSAFQPDVHGCPHVKYPGLKPTGQAFLDDLAASAHACISMAQWTGETQWLERASAFVHAAETHWTGKAYQFSTQHQDDPAFLAHFDWEDDVLPSAQSTMASCLLRLGHLLGRLDWTERANLLVASALSHPSLSSDRAWSWWALAPWTRPDAEHLVIRAGIFPANRPKHPLWGPGDLPANVYGQVCTMQACTLSLNTKKDLDAYLHH